MNALADAEPQTLRISKDPDLGNEGYLLAISDRVEIHANALTGAFWATRTLLQLLAQNRTLSAGAARDWPSYAERGLMIDNGRAFFSPEWLESHIRELSYLKLNIFHYFDAAWDYAQEKYGNNPDIGGQDVAIDFINELSALIRSYGKTPRIWNDVLAMNGKVEQLDKNIVIEHWINRGEKPDRLAAAGYALMNDNWNCTYFTDEETLYADACAPNIFADGTQLDPLSVRGMDYHVWCDPAPDFCPDSETVSANIRVPLRALAQNSWGAPRGVQTAARLRELSDMIGRAPGFLE